MFEYLRRWHQRRIINSSTVSEKEWQQALAALPLLKGLDDDELKQLKTLAILLMHYKSFEGARGLELTQSMILHIALQASLPILKLGLSAYDGWVSVIVYPAGFVPQRTFADEAGVVHQERSHLAGEAWQRGPVILGWEGASHAGEIDGQNLVIHEFAHKLDMQNGAANGFPPLHSGMVQEEWAAAFSEAYDKFQHHCDGHHPDPISCYGATSPAEFFAVFSEVFFERPALLKHHYPAVYHQLSRYYRQDPTTRLS